MKIEKLSASPDRAGRYRTELEDGQILRLYRQTIEDFALYAGQDLDPARLKELQIAAGEMSARMRAVRIVSASSVSKKDLEHRLIQKGEDPNHAKAAVEWMSGLDLVDDEKTAAQIVARCISRGYGLSRAKQALYEKRIPREFWEEALADYPDQSEEILSYLRSHLSNNDPKAVRRTVDALIRRGHSYGLIRRCMEQLSMDECLFPEE